MMNLAAMNKKRQVSTPSSSSTAAAAAAKGFNVHLQSTI